MLFCSCRSIYSKVIAVTVTIAKHFRGDVRVYKWVEGEGRGERRERAERGREEGWLVM